MTPKKRRVDKRIEMCISETPIMKDTGTDVALTVCSKYLMLTNLETTEVMAKHDMPRISFASGGDPVSGFGFINLLYSFYCIFSNSFINQLW